MPQSAILETIFLNQIKKNKQNKCLQSQFSQNVHGFRILTCCEIQFLVHPQPLPSPVPFCLRGVQVKMRALSSHLYPHPGPSQSLLWVKLCIYIYIYIYNLCVDIYMYSLLCTFFYSSFSKVPETRFVGIFLVIFFLHFPVLIFSPP